MPNPNQVVAVEDDRTLEQRTKNKEQRFKTKNNQLKIQY